MGYFRNLESYVINHQLYSAFWKHQKRRVNTDSIRINLSRFDVNCSALIAPLLSTTLMQKKLLREWGVLAKVVKLFFLVSICLISGINAHYISDMWWNLFALNTAGISIIKSWTLRSCPSWIHDDRDTVPHTNICVGTTSTCHSSW